MLEIESEQLQKISKHLEEAYPAEGCGVLMGVFAGGRRTVERVEPVGNENIRLAARRYLISADEIRNTGRRAESEGLEILGFYHSHPDVEAIPSDFDRRHAWPWYSYLIVSVREGRRRDERCWRLKEDRTGFDEEELQIVKENPCP